MSHKPVCPKFHPSTAATKCKHSASIEAPLMTVLQHSSFHQLPMTKVQILQPLQHSASLLFNLEVKILLRALI